MKKFIFKNYKKINKKNLYYLIIIKLKKKFILFNNNININKNFFNYLNYI